MSHQNETHAEDARHDVPFTPSYEPADQGAHIGSDHQESTAFFRPTYGPRGEVEGVTLTDTTPEPKRPIGQEINHPYARRPEFPGFPPARPATPQGLQWHSGDGMVRHDLAAFPWRTNRELGIETSNVELRTLHAHLMEAITLARAEMRDRGMVVDF